MSNSKLHFSSFRQKELLDKHPVLVNLLNNNKTQRRSLSFQHTNLAPLSSMYGSDFFYPSTIDQQQQQHEYDNLTFSHHYYNPLPILVDCQRCSRSIDRSSFRDISCQVPSDEENTYQHIQFEHRKIKRLSPLYISPPSTPPLCSPPIANSLLASYHFRRKRSLSSYVALHRRSKSAPSASSSTTLSSISSRTKHLSEKKSKRVPPSLSPLQSDTTVAESASHVASTPSTTNLLRSIKASIHAMKNRLKDIHRLSEVGMRC
jgi:hypothetical protein